MAFPFMRAFIALFLYRYFRLVVNLVSFWTFKPIPPPENPKLTAQDVTVILPTLEGCGDELVETIRTILDNHPYELLLVTIEANRKKAEKMLSEMPASKSRIRLFTVTHPNKRRQMTRAIPEVRTAITVFADDDVSWPRTVLRWILAPFEKDERYGGVVTCQRLRRAIAPTFSQRIWGFLGALYLERRNFDCAATTHVDGGLPCMSGRTVAYKTHILQDEGFTYAFTNEEWWFGKYQLNADDDNFITRWMVSHGWETFMQYHPEAEVLTTLEDNPKFLKQCARWSRSNWRSNLTRHYIRYPVDILLLPVSILFGYFHGGIKMYAVLTLNVTTWGSRDGADDYDAERMKRRTDIDRMKRPYYPNFITQSSRFCASSPCSFPSSGGSLS
ncbi:hypothetical protein Asppvi_010567 [Aspergillus pseudoviridinutans]|uniref:Polysaccharide synthase Cps1 n=1 Tax=Aspergillus pseudoviridinutans TaxID=1517512 RepID=A0A9P3F026_9EURO|nr:uncharacterized protein Asppvi_010567 [Aspergillus pseudoviridinutans]GIJ91598.1 hypothetical protein Asppvi_010567 [Aspergillus pseudoviridinutans]